MWFLLGLIVASNLIALALFISTLNTLNRARIEVEGHARAAWDIDRARGQMLDLGRQLDQFLVDRDMTHMLSAESDIHGAREELHASPSLPQPLAEEAIREIGMLGALLFRMRDQQVEVGLDENSGLYGSLRGHAHQLEAALGAYRPEDAARADRWMVELLQLRRDEKDFMLRGDVRHVQAFDDRAARLDRDLSRSSLPPADIENLRTILSDYRHGFLTWSRAERARQATYAAFRSELAVAADRFGTETAILRAQANAGIDRAEAGRKQAIAVMLALVALSLLVTLVGGRRVARGIAAPLQQISRAVKDINNAEAVEGIRDLKLDHELGEVVRAAVDFHYGEQQKESFIANEREKLNAERARQARVAERIDHFRTESAAAIRQVIAVVEALRSASGHLAQQTQTAADNAIEARDSFAAAASNIEEVDRAAENLTQEIDSISHQADEALNASQSMTDRSARAIEDARALQTASDEIHGFIRQINSIAEQTNLLALNATIEAARAGEAGRGFTIVAQEVKALAKQSADATDAIGKQFDSLTRTVAAVSAAVDEIRGISTETGDFSRLIAQSVGTQRDASRAINSNTQGASSRAGIALSDMAELTNAVTASRDVAGETDQLSDKLNEVAMELSQSIETFLNDTRDTASDHGSGQALDAAGIELF